ncbi:DUF2975 domain-containing protein [Gordonibacter massiliensis (ex Traore et al. 2017)]|uniref:DUF2975 domain-containing protein n=1 Tax=Gordonibacter massiliensis (ex Traore et al. 2017) TaxID=1841863 RepID=UPI001C8BA2E4|nr:DUF2975 domain-containing protein [Gordonibacter massiliensis (ex Traore et al. 2017)]MBX9034502.1 DUF2975 domain-containing protein [Gordonibacter massiliensis (ex Traore et al. 2017)]
MGFSKNQALPTKLQLRTKSGYNFVIILTVMTALAFAVSIAGLIRSFANPEDAIWTTPTEAAGSTVAVGLVFAIAIILLLMMRDIQNTGKPFTMKNVWRLRAVAVLVMAECIVPGCAALVAAMAASALLGHGSFSGQFGTLEFAALAIGFFIAIISEVFYYGCELQQDVDSIA